MTTNPSTSSIASADSPGLTSPSFMARRLLGTAFAALVVGCGGGVTALSPISPALSPPPRLISASVNPSQGQAGVDRNIDPTITVTTENVSQIDSSAITYVCSGNTVSTSPKVTRSSDQRTAAILLQPSPNSSNFIVPGSTCTISGLIVATGAGGTTSLAITSIFTTYRAPVARTLARIVGDTDSPGTANASLLNSSFYAPSYITQSADGNIYVAEGCTGFYDSHSLIRKISPVGNISTFSGSPVYGGGKVVVNESENSRCVQAITVAQDGSIYTVDWIKHEVNKISSNGIVTRVAGLAGLPGAADGSVTTAQFNRPSGITSDLSGNLFIADTRNHTIRKIDTRGVVTTLGGSAGNAGSVSASLTTTRFNSPGVVHFDTKTGRLFVADRNGVHTILGATLTTLVTHSQMMSETCGGSDVASSQIDVDQDNRFVIAWPNCSVAAIYNGNQLEKILGRGLYAPTRGRGDSDGVADAAKLFFPSGVKFVSGGNVLISDIKNQNLKIYSPNNNTISLWAGKRNFIDPVDGNSAVAKISNAASFVDAGNGEYLFAQGAQQIRKLRADGSITTLTISDGLLFPLQANSDGSFVVASTVDNKIQLYNSQGTFNKTLFTSGSKLFSPLIASAVTKTGQIYFTNSNFGLSKFDGVTVTEVLQPPKGGITGVAVDEKDNVFARGDDSIVRVTPGGVTSTIADSSGLPSGTNDPILDGKTELVGFGSGFGGAIAVDTAGAIYVYERINSVIRKVANGRSEVVVGTPWVNQTSLGNGAGSLNDVRGIHFEPATNSLIILTDRSVLRAVLP